MERDGKGSILREERGVICTCIEDGWMGKIGSEGESKAGGEKGALVHVHMVAVPGTVEEGTETVQHPYKNTNSQYHHHHHHHCM